MTAKRILILGALALLPGLSPGGVAAVNQSVGELPAGKAIIITHSVLVEGGTSVTSQGTVSGNNFSDVLTDDPDTAAPADPTVTQVQAAPTVANLSRNIDEDQIVTFGTSDFDGGFSDANGGDSLQVLRITSLPDTGTLFRSGGGGVINSVPTDVPRSQIAGMTYHPQGNFGGPTASFGWNASDGTDFAASPAAYTFNITEVNDPPLPLADTVFRFSSSSLKIPVADLLANDNDSPGENDVPLKITSVNYTGGNGATVTLSGDTVFYEPNGHTGPDTFTYAVEDSRGGVFPNALVSVKIIDDQEQSKNVVSVDLPGDGTAIFTAVGIPGRTYRVQKIDSGDVVWIDLPGGSVVADAQGRIVYIDPGPLPGTRIYRTIQP